MASLGVETQYFHMFFCQFSVGDYWKSRKANQEVF